MDTELFIASSRVTGLAGIHSVIDARHGFGKMAGKVPAGAAECSIPVTMAIGKAPRGILSRVGVLKLSNVGTGHVGPGHARAERKLT